VRLFSVMKSGVACYEFKGVSLLKESYSLSIITSDTFEVFHPYRPSAVGMVSQTVIEPIDTVASNFMWSEERFYLLSFTRRHEGRAPSLSRFEFLG
jgi:hypothetical protein